MSESAGHWAMEPYDLREHTSLLVATFRYSRGSPVLQENILEFWAHEYGDRFRLDTLELAVPRIVEIAGRFIYTSGIHPQINAASHIDKADTIESRIEKEVRNQGETLREALYHRAQHEHLSQQDLLVWFAHLATADQYRIPFADDEKTSYEVGMPIKFKSNVVDYGLLRKSTGIDEMDAFFGVATDAFLKGPDDTTSGRYLDIGEHLLPVIAAHLSYNPGDAIPLSRISTF